MALLPHNGWRQASAVAAVEAEAAAPVEPMGSLAFPQALVLAQMMMAAHGQAGSWQEVAGPSVVPLGDYPWKMGSHSFAKGWIVLGAGLHKDQEVCQMVALQQAAETG